MARKLTAIEHLERAVELAGAPYCRGALDMLTRDRDEGEAVGDQDEQLELEGGGSDG